MKNVRISNFYVFFMIKSIHFFCMSEPPDLPAVLLNCGHETTSSANYRWHGQHRREVTDNPIAIWQYTVSGQGAIRVGDQVHTLETGKAFLVTVPDDHEYFLPPGSERWEFIFLTVTGTALLDLTRMIHARNGAVFALFESSALVREVLEVINLYKTTPLPDSYKASTLAYKFFMMLASELAAVPTGVKNAPLFSEVTDLLTKNPDFCRFSVSDLANHLGYSRAHFTRKFAAESNISPGKFLLDWRLNMAAKILSSQYIQIKAVAYQTGFTDVSHFCRVFRRKYHLSPEEFRRSNSGKA